MTSKKSPSRGLICSAMNCKHYILDHPALSFFRFPTDPDRCRLWLKHPFTEHLRDKSALQLSKSYRLCAEHFEASQFTSSYKDRLNWNAVPTIFNHSTDAPEPVLIQHTPEHTGASGAAGIQGDVHVELVEGKPTTSAAATDKQEKMGSKFISILKSAAEELAEQNEEEIVKLGDESGAALQTGDANVDREIQNKTSNHSTKESSANQNEGEERMEEIVVKKIAPRVRKRRGTRCTGTSCKNYSKDNPGLSFFRFPRDEKRCRQWLKNGRITHLDNHSAEKLNRSYSMCANHFEDSQFTNDYKDRLNWNAVPTLFDIPNPPPRIECKRPTPRSFFLKGNIDNYKSMDTSCAAKALLQLSGVTLVPKESTVDALPTAASVSHPQSYTVTPAAAAANADLGAVTLPDDTKTKAGKRPVDPKMCALRRKVNSLSAKVRRMQRRMDGMREKRLISKEDCIKSLSHHLSGPTLQFIQTQVKLNGRSACGLRFQPHDIAIAYSLYNASPKCYRLLSKLFVLPSTSTLQKSVNECVIGADSVANETQVAATEEMPETDGQSSDDENSSGNESSSEDVDAPDEECEVVVDSAEENTIVALEGEDGVYYVQS